LKQQLNSELDRIQIINRTKIKNPEHPVDAVKEKTENPN